MRTLVFMLMALFFTNAPFACSFYSPDDPKSFKPTFKIRQQNSGSTQTTKDDEEDESKPLPTPVVRVTGISRGSVEPGSSCDDAGMLSLEIALPPKSTHKISGLGIYFRVKSGKGPYGEPNGFFPYTPITNKAKNGKIRFFFIWLDGHPKNQSPIDLTVEAFFVNNNLKIGSPTTFRIKADKGAG